MVVPDKSVKFRDPCSKLSREVPPEAVGGGILDSFFSRENLRPEVDSDVIPGVDVCIKYGDSRSNGCRDIRAVGFVSNERTNMTEARDL